MSPGHDARPRVGVSACLLGQEVRWDGTNARDGTVTDLLAPLFEWVPVCPEAEAGMGIPREAVQLVAVAGGRPRMLGVTSRRDWTEAMRAWARRRAGELRTQGLCGFVFKSSSPSCGLQGVKVYDAAGLPHPTGRGLFADALIREQGLLPVADERSLADPVRRETFLERVLALHASLSRDCEAPRSSWR